MNKKNLALFLLSIGLLLNCLAAKIHYTKPTPNMNGLPGKDGSLVLTTEYTNDEIATAIFYAEGGLKTSFPYGIKSVKCESDAECRDICIQTIQNNRTRYVEYGNKQFKSYLEFLASRYCPSSVNGCETWLPNVQFFLEKGK